MRHSGPSRLNSAVSVDIPATSLAYLVMKAKDNLWKAKVQRSEKMLIGNESDAQELECSVGRP